MIKTSDKHINWNEPLVKESTDKRLYILNKVTDWLGKLLVVLTSIALFMWFVILWL